MRNDTGKRVFIALLMGCFLFIFWLSVYGNETVQAGVDAMQMSNPSIFIEARDGDVFYIGGNGKLTRSDVVTLLDSMDIGYKEMTHVIVGDEITEIGYKALSDSGKMETLRLGRGVVTIDTGAIKKCANLKYVFLPSGVKRVSRDMLFGCESAIVVTDGSIENLPELHNTNSDRVLQGIDSYEALEAAVATISSEELPQALKTWWE